MNPIEVQGLTKSFGHTQALNGFDLTVEPGEVRGFLGPNGAGKSTTIRVLLGLLRADSGTARLFDGDPWTDAVSLHRRLAYVPGDVALWPNLTGGEAIDYLTRLHGKVNPDRKADLLERFELDPTKKSGTYSKGNRQKVALVAALSVDAELYILDEPTSGLDPLMEATFTDYLSEIKQRGSSILLSSHILSEVEKICDSVTIIRSGRAVQSGSLAELRHLTRSRVVATVSTDAKGISELEGVHDATLNEQGSQTVSSFDVDSGFIGTVLARLSEYGIEEITVTPPSLEDLFMRHYGSEQGHETSVQEAQVK